MSQGMEFFSLDPKRGDIALFYTLFQDKLTFVKSATVRTWPQAAVLRCSELRALGSLYAATHKVQHWELPPKIVSRWDYIPVWIPSFSSIGSTMCWWECGQVGSLYHILWASKCLNSFWWKMSCVQILLKFQFPLPQPKLRSGAMPKGIPHHSYTCTFGSQNHNHKKLEAPTVPQSSRSTLFGQN